MATDKVFTTRNFEGERRVIPLPIQTYFWRQTSQLLKPKLVRRNYESACLSFERIICENRIQDLQPSLASAVKSINRWHLIQSSVPYILQCCSLLLSNRGRLGNIDRLGNAERELLFTLHWILLEGPRVCCVVDTDSLLYPLTTIEQFVHELTPHVYHMRESDLTFRLENGVAIWGPLWRHEQPSITPFTCEVISKDTDPEHGGKGGQSSSADQSTAADSISDFSAATFFDVAVLKCLLSTGWDENGVMWALRYLTAYLKKEFNLPDQATSRGTSEEIRDQIPVQGSVVLTVPPDVSGEGSVVHGNDCVKPDGAEGQKVNKEGKARSGGSSSQSAANTPATCVCQIGDVTNNITSQDQRSTVTNGVQLTVPQKSETTNPSIELQSENLSTLKIPEGFDEERSPAQGLERTGSIRLRIRVQSSPGGTAGGRVLTAVPSPTGSMTQQEAKTLVSDDSQDVCETRTFQNTKVYIKPSNTLQLPVVGAGNTNKQDSGDPLDAGCHARDLENGNMNDVATIGSSVSSTKETILQTNVVEPSYSTSSNYDAQPDPSRMCTRIKESNNHHVSFESMVSYECEVQEFHGGMVQTDEVTKREQLKDAAIFKRLSEHTNSSHASSSSVESEIQPLLKPPTMVTTNRKALALLGLCDNPRTPVNRDSYTKIDRYFVFPGAADYITIDGRLSSLMILQALYNITRENPSALISDLTLTILQQLVTIHQNKKSKKRGSSIEVDDRTVAETHAVGFRSPHTDNILGRLRASFYGRPPSFLSLAMGCLVSVIKALGCPLGCGDGCRGNSGDRLRNTANNLLTQLLRSEEAAFKLWLHQFARLEPPEDLVDFLHALLGFCEEDQEQSDDEMMPAPKSDKPTRKKSLFSMPEGVNGVIIGSIFKILLSRVAEMNFLELKNLTFYGELRQLLRFVKESYGSIFWKVALSGLRDSAYKESKDQPDAGKTPGLESHTKSVSTVRKTSVVRMKVERTPTYKTKRTFLKKLARITTESSDSSGSLTRSLKFSSGMETSPIETALSPRSKRKIFTWTRKQKAVGTQYDSDEDLLDAPDPQSEQQSSSKRKLLKSKTPSRKKIEDIFPIAKKGDPTPPLLSESTLPIDIVLHEFETKPVDVEALRSGMVRFRFLLHGGQPGSIPDPKILASMLDLEAPAVARACLLLECCILVHKCNQGEWPQWLRGSLPSLAHRRGGVSSSSPTPFMFAQRRNLVAMNEAGVLFREWGVALGKKLEQVLAKKRRNLLPSIDEEGGKVVLTDIDDMEEDFLDEATLSDSVKVCPYPLLMIACQLLLEITAFLRESHGLYSVSKPASRPLHRFNVQRRRPSVTSHRRSMAFSPELHQRRLSTVIGGGGERIRRASAWSQSSLQTDFPSSPSRTLQEPPMITVSGTDANANNPDADQEGKSDRTRNRHSLYYPRVNNQNSPKTAKRTTKRGALGGEGESVRFRSKSTKCDAKHLSVDVTMFDEDDESDDEDPTLNLPWLNAVIQLNSSNAFLCDHLGVCPVNCHQRQSRSCTRMVKSLKAVYGTLNKNDKASDKQSGRVHGIHGSPLISAPQVGSVEQATKKDKEDTEMIQYISSSLASLTHCPFSVIAKAGTVIDKGHLMDTLPVVWELLLDEDQQLVSSVASVFLLTGIRLRDTVEQMLHKELTCTDANERVKSLQRYEVLWQSRYHAWPRLEEGARVILKVPPPKVDFTLPSPAVGMPASQPPDCPWDASLILEEQQDKKKKDKKKIRDNGSALKKQQERSEFLLRAVPVSMETTVGVNVSEDEKGESQQVEAELWPQAVSSAIPDIIKMMDDVLVDSDKIAVMEVARRLVWRCLVDDPVLFFRIILEQVTKRDKQEEHISLLRKLLLYITELPQASSRFLINNLIGVAMYYARTSKPGSQDSLALVLSLLWQAVPSMRGFMFKDLKQCLRKEHCDNALRISSNVPGAKKLCVILPDQENEEEEKDQEKTKETVPVHDEMTFGKVLEAFKARYQDSGSEGKELYLIDKKSDQILEERDHVRDVYTHRKGFPSPLLLLDFLDQELAFNKRQAQAFTNKIAEIGRVLLTSSILNALPNQKHISFLHGEFSRQISFPRKALECDFSLYAGGTKGSELAALDVIHKSVWVELITSLFQSMYTDFPWSSTDLNLFMNVINGAILLHCEDGAMLRLCLSSLINIAVHFSHIFASDGYQHIFPSLLQVYSHHQSNKVVTTAIEFAMKQFYILHQKPCLLQLFASVAPILLIETRPDGNEEESDAEDLSGKIPPKCLFNLLTSLDKPSPDSLEVLDLVRAEKPLKPMDSCYESSNDPPGVSQIDTAVRLCVTVVNFAPESERAVQMVVVLSAILPHYLNYLRTDSSAPDSEEKLKAELTGLTSLVTSMNVLIKSSEVLTRLFVHFQSYKAFSDKSGIFPDLASTTSLMFGHGSISSTEAPSAADEGELGRRPFLERLRAQEEKDEVMQALEEYRKPRDALLILVSDFIRICAPRLEELEAASLPPRYTVPDLLDSISVNTLAQIVYSLLKLAVYDHVTLSCLGVKRYMMDALPLLKGSPEALEASMLLILKRVDKMFEKLVNKPDLMRCIDWKSLEVYLKGLYLTLCKRPSIANSPYLKTLVNICTSLILQERATAAVSVAANLPFAPILSPPTFFADTVIKLASRLMHVMQEHCSLREMCGNSINLGGASRTEKVFVRLILPICIRLGSGRSDAPKASLEDVSYALSCFLLTVATKNPSTPGMGPVRLSFVDEDLELPRSLTFATPHESKTSSDEISESLYCAAYLGLKVLMVCCEDRLATEWYRIYQAMETIVAGQITNVGFWDFMNFCVSYRTPLFLLICPLIRTKVSHLRPKNKTERVLKQRVLTKISRPPLVVSSRNALITRFLEELSFIKQKRPAAGFQDIEEGEEEDVQKEEKKPLVLQAPPLGRERSSSAPQEPATDSKDAKRPPPITRSVSLKAKKTVSFSPAPSFDDDRGSSASSLGDVRSGKEKRKKWLLRKQETVEEQDSHNDKDLVDTKTGQDPFAHQRGATVRPGKVSTGRGPRRRFEKMRAVTSERKTSNPSAEVETKIESPTSGIVESQGERFEMKFFETDILVTDPNIGEAPESKGLRASLTPPIAKPESVTISLSPDSSPSRRSPASEMEDTYPDILESLKPLPPIPPVKFTSQSDVKHDSENARNGTIAPESNLAADYDVERAQRLNKNRWWHKVSSNVEIISTDEDSQRLQRYEISLSEASEVQRETNV
ncbi:protein unc-80 homolog isoform X2 [Stylophora pistillata]|uniref:Protein unc-80-like n=1 Tax=Stylophora pistillata TaxID=50429 RepID=A0A2B4SKH9_STYPI|nr:protein unc-80 homolog isoform X2 [Stylophora pistillata]PFX29002.1 Protein unc-80-like [Stylophora pistillata]